MKKTYISPTFITITLVSGHVMVTGSLEVSGNSGSATFFDDNASGEAMGKEFSNVNVWDEEW